MFAENLGHCMLHLKPITSDSVLQRLREMCEADSADGALGPWSSGERIAVALTLDRLDWLTALNLSALEAVDRLPAHCRDACVRLQKELR